MKPAVALATAVACAVVAVALVGIDLAMNLEVKLETKNAAGQWIAWRSSTDYDKAMPYTPHEACAGPDLRLTVHNGQLLGSSVAVAASYNSAKGTGASLFEETWDLARGETRSKEFTVPASAFEASTGPDGLRGPDQASVNILVGNDYRHSMYTCIQKEAPQ